MQGSNLTAEQSHEVNLLQQETAKPDIEIENGPYVLTHGSIDEKKNVCQFLFNGVLFTNVTEHSQVLNYPLHLTNLKVLRVIGNLFKKTALSCKAQQGCSLYKTLI